MDPAKKESFSEDEPSLPDGGQDFGDVPPPLDADPPNNDNDVGGEEEEHMNKISDD
jgi:hypothetical protein